MLALTMGDPAGIGPEITAGAWAALRGEEDIRFALIADPALAAARLGGCPVHVVAQLADAAAVFPEALPIVAPATRLEVAPVAGRPDPRNAAAITGSIADAVASVRRGEAAGLVTNPIAKSVLKQAGFPHPGHTEYLAALMGRTGDEVMMLAGPELRVVPVTIHLSLRQALDSLRTDEIVRVARTTARSLLEMFGIAAPRLAIAGLNPHAGEDGHMGDEEITLIRPAMERLRAEGISLLGPLPPDTMFTEAARARYDAAICMYHDQALIPLKTLDMARGVNVTLGIGLVRTSPDHGTAFDIAGTGRAEPTSLIEALRLAGRLTQARAA